MPGIFSCKIEMEAWRKSMRLFAEKVLPNAVANTLNRTADLVKAGAIHNLKQDFHVRTPYTLNSMRVSYARPKENLSSYSMVGTISKYLPIQETGGVSKKPEIPTVKVSRGGSIANIVPPRLRMKALTASMATGPAQGRRSRSGMGKPFMMTLRRGPGIFVRKAGELLMLRDLSRQETRIKGTHWFSRAVDKFANFSAMRATFHKELDAQMRHHGLGK